MSAVGCTRLGLNEQRKMKKGERKVRLKTALQSSRATLKEGKQAGSQSLSPSRHKQDSEAKDKGKRQRSMIDQRKPSRQRQKPKIDGEENETEASDCQWQDDRRRRAERRR